MLSKFTSKGAEESIAKNLSTFRAAVSSFWIAIWGLSIFAAVEPNLKIVVCVSSK